MLPAQLVDTARWGAVADQPERRLMLAVLSDAIVALQRRRPRVPYRGRGEAERWVLSDDRRWPCSFVNVCEALNLAPEPLRRAVLALRPVAMGAMRPNPAARRRLLAGKALATAAAVP
jgi:hypothetical protein